VQLINKVIYHKMHCTNLIQRYFFLIQPTWKELATVDIKIAFKNYQKLGAKGRGKLISIIISQTFTQIYVKDSLDRLKKKLSCC